MTNLDKAIRVLDGQGAYCGQCSREPGDPLDDCRDCAAGLKMYAEALKEAGLLMPDLPEPDDDDEEVTGWEVGYHVQRSDYSTGAWSEVPKGQVWIEPNGAIGMDVNQGYFYIDADEAEKIALTLLAAANYAEKEQGNEF